MRRFTCRWIPMALVTLCIVNPMSSWALGLGEIDVDSALNERFAGTINVVDVEGYGEAEIVVSLATAEDFDRVGVERFFYLTNLKFAVEETASGAAQIRVTSPKAVSEPYLNFIVEVLWPKGRLLKEYTVLLDPPTYSEVAAPSVSAPAQADPVETVAAPATRSPSTQVRLSENRTTTSNSNPPPDGIMTGRSDTLWSIAAATLPSEQVTVQQHMLAIQRKNPEAFLRKNINLLKAGYVLSIPTQQEALAVARPAAAADVLEQSKAWREDRVASALPAANTQTPATQTASELRSQVDATAKPAQQASSAAQAEGQVRILANSGELASGTAAGDEPGVNQLIEEKETLTRQVDELTYQLDREKEIAASQSTVNDRQLEVKSQEISALQEQLKAQREAIESARENQNQSAAPAAEPTPWWQAPMVLFGVIGALILALAGFMFNARRNRAQASGEVIDTSGSIPYEPQNVEPRFEAPALNPTDDDLDDADIESDSDGILIAPQIAGSDDDDQTLLPDDDIDDIAGDSTAAATGDVIGEAEIYMAYGRYGQAVGLLGGVLGSDPSRHDVRLKLLEVFVESGEPEGFSEHAQYLQDNCSDADVLEAAATLQTQMQDAQMDMSDDIPELNAVDSESSDVSASGASEPDDEFDLDLDELGGDPNQSAQGSTDELLDVDGVLDLDDDDPIELDVDGDLDDAFELEFDAEPEIENATAGVALAADNLEIDDDPLDIDDLETADFDLEAALDNAEGELDKSPAPIDETLADDVSNELGDLGDLEDLDTSGEATDLDADDDEFDFDTGDEADVNATKLDLAAAYIDMGDSDGAEDILREVVEEGSDEQRQKADKMLKGMAS